VVLFAIKRERDRERDGQRGGTEERGGEMDIHTHIEYEHTGETES